MSNTMSRKLLSLILAVLMAFSAFIMPVAADETTIGAEDVTQKGTSSSLTDIKELMSTLTYDEYINSYKNAVKPEGVIPVDVADYNVEESTEDAKVLEDYMGKDYAIESGEGGKVTFNINVDKAGLYCLRLDYVPVESTSTVNIERILYVNGKVPFKEARNLVMTKKWANEYTENKDGKLRFEVDQNGNEIRPDNNVVYDWQTFVLRDYNGFYNEPLAIYLEEGENTISLEGSRHAAVFADVELFSYEAPKSYDDVMAEYEKKGYKNAEGSFTIDGETPIATSSNQIYPDNDPVSSATDPQSADSTMKNLIATSMVGEWLEYELPVPESGIYTLMFRFRQDTSSSPVNRKFYIDGEVPYDAAENIKFGYADKWQTGNATAADGKVFKIYLEKGVHTLRIEVTLGDVADMLRRATAVQTALNNDYLEILRLTGASPDEYRDYGFSRVMPDTMRDLVDQSKEIYELVDILESSGQKSESSSNLKQVADRVYSMGTDEDNVAKNLDGLKSDLSTLASWVSSMSGQMLEIDYITVQSPDAKIPKAEHGFFASTWFEIKKFFASFYVDYNSLAGAENTELKVEEPVEAWTAASRDHAQIIKDYANDTFTMDSGVPVTVKLVAGGTLLPSMLAGIGPDIALDGMTSTNQAIVNATGSIIDYAVRGAVLPIQEREGFDEVKEWFPEAAFGPVTLYGNVYGLPTSLDWNMMFYRKDIFATLGIDIPKTWDDIMASVPVLQFNNMEVGLTRDTTTFATFIFQNGGEFWADDGMRVNFESNTSLEAFEYMTNMFTQYSLPLTYDALNRFKTGEIPLFLGSYITYNTITIFATELAGLWGFTAMPGTYDDEGNLNRTVVGSADAVCMVKSCDDVKNSWKFMQWYCGKDFQVAFSNELINILGEAGMKSVANKAALEELQWKKADREALLEQIDNVRCLPQYPGSYFISRYVDFAVNNAYNMGADPVESLLGYVSAINKEITRKRGEFGFETIEVGQTLADKRLGEALALIDDLSDADRETYKDVIAEAEAQAKANVKDIAGIEAAADALVSANAKLFKAAAEKLDDAAKWLGTYDN